MEINKQLFEDVLSGKLKGYFVLSNGSKVRSEKCERRYSFRNYNKKSYTFYDEQSRLWFDYYEDGRFSNFNIPSANDIVDFIPDTDMKENELTIEIPNGKIVDWDESKKQNKVVLKDKQLTYEEICEKLFQPNGGYHICGNGEIVSSFCADLFLSNTINATSKHQLECILAKNKLANVAMYLNDGWKPTNMEDAVYYLTMDLGARIFVGSCSKLGGYYFGKIMFKSGGLAKQAIEILGEETIKLALEPLGI